MTLIIKLYFIVTHDTIFLLRDVTILVNNNYKSSLQVFFTLYISTNHFHTIYSSEWLTVRGYYPMTKFVRMKILRIYTYFV